MANARAVHFNMMVTPCKANLDECRGVLMPPDFQVMHRVRKAGATGGFGVTATIFGIAAGV